MHEIGRNPKDKELNSTTRKHRVLNHLIMGSSIHTFVRSLVHTFAFVLYLHIIDIVFINFILFLFFHCVAVFETLFAYSGVQIAVHYYICWHKSEAEDKNSLRHRKEPQKIIRCIKAVKRFVLVACLFMCLLLPFSARKKSEKTFKEHTRLYP